MSDGPERIFLQPDDSPEQDDMPHDGRTWCEDNISGRDTEYVRADLVTSLRADNSRLQAVVDTLHPRVLKLAAREDEPFIVIGPREPYFGQVYNLIKKHEKRMGDWGHSCEVARRKALKVYEQLQDLWLDAFQEITCDKCETGNIPVGEMKCYYCGAKRPIEKIRDAQDSFRKAALAAQEKENEG